MQPGDTTAPPRRLGLPVPRRDRTALPLPGATDRFRVLVETMPGVAYVAAPGEAGAWHYLSPRLTDVLGHDPATWLDDPSAWVRLLHPEDRDRVLAAEAGWGRDVDCVHVSEYRLRDASGRWRWIQDAVTARAGGPDGTDVVWFGVLTDVTEVRESQQALRVSEQQLRSVLETAQDGFVSLDEAGRVLEWNERAEEMFGRRRAEVLGRVFADVVVPPAKRAAHTAALGRLAGRPDRPVVRRSVETTALRADGSEFPVDLVLWETRAGGVRRYNAFVRDITERRQMQDDLRSLAYSDTLTGLANRTRLTERLQDALRRPARAGGRPALVFLDLDDFKAVNDSLGHVAGDRVLTTVAARLVAVCPATATVARFAGDEFAVLLPSVPGTDAALAVAEQVAAVLREPVTVDGRRLVLGASVGLAVAGPDTGATEVLRDADAAMYEAKRAGKDRCTVFDPEVHARALARLELRNDLEHALEREELSVVFQPYVRLSTGRIAGFETLLRWRHPQRGAVPPLDFVPLAEETGRIREIGAWVLRRACAAAAGWPAAADGGAPTVSVNVSTVQLRDTGFAATVTDVLATTGLPPSRLVLEITESVLLTDVDGSREQLERLRGLGVRVAVDDFGTGYSSLRYLQDLPLDILKIDKSFVEHLTGDPDRTSMAELVVLIGRALGLSVVGEGVEGPDQVEALQRLGCDLAQGYHLGHPVDGVTALALASGR
ncbi:putative bifunctional diguanylate cyclase/phosphodiesterase [Aquipuribacter sp. SD81]|uniref:putative bifunctional diguanylate cyclase/phosphodiesterase n=1 Tax=Aquipuribacter sp. SD81 TaxID=3127703 RepID=UPI0030181CEC